MRSVISGPLIDPTGSQSHTHSQRGSPASLSSSPARLPNCRTQQQNDWKAYWARVHVRCTCPSNSSRTMHYLCTTPIRSNRPEQSASFSNVWLHLCTSPSCEKQFKQQTLLPDQELLSSTPSPEDLYCFIMLIKVHSHQLGFFVCFLAVIANRLNI